MKSLSPIGASPTQRQKPAHWQLFRVQRAAQIDGWLAAERSFAAAKGRHDAQAIRRAGGRMSKADKALTNAAVAFAYCNTTASAAPRLARALIRRTDEMLNA